MSESRFPLRLLGAVLAAVALVVVVAAPARAAEPITPSEAAAGWLAGELAGNGGTLPSAFGGTDWGLTIDAALALLGAGYEGPETAQALAAVSSNLSAYVTGGEWAPADRYANALSKALLLEQVSGEDLGGDFDVEAELRALEVDEGDQEGRLSDLSAFGDFSNGFGHALAVMGLSATDGGVPGTVLDFFLGQQCPGGGFRIYYEGYPLESDPETFEPIVVVEDITCTTADQSDPDATAFAVQALMAAPSGPAVQSALAEAVAYLLAQQQPSGAFLGTGSANSNTTGLAGATLRAAGHEEEADAAAAFLASVQHTASCSDFGAVAYDVGAFAAGIDADRAQWVRSTTQGIFGLGLPVFLEIGTAPVAAGLSPIACPAPPAPVDPPDPDPSVATLSLDSTTVAAGGTISGTASGFQPGEEVVATLFSAPVRLGAVVADDAGSVSFRFAVPAAVEPGVHRLELVGQVSGTTVSAEVEILGQTAPGTLPATGPAEAGTQAIVAIGLLAAGAGLLHAARRRAAAGSGRPS